MKISDLAAQSLDQQPQQGQPRPESTKDLVLRTLYEQLGPRLANPNLSEQELLTMVGVELSAIVAGLQVPLTAMERQQLVNTIVAEAIGLGPLESLINDPTVGEIMVNACDKVWIERRGRIELSPVKFADDDALMRIIERIVTRVGRRIDESSPYVDARLPDGSRVNAIVPPLAIDGPSLTIRKFPSNPLQVNDLIDRGTITPQLATFLAGAVKGKMSAIISGGSGTGKTTLLNIMSGFIPPGERVISIEDAAELQLQQPNLVRLESRPANVEGRGAVTIRELVANALRMRPDRIVVGECRSGEALDMLQAMNTGHDGSMSTIHANTPRDALSRLETLVLMAGTDLPSRAIREQIASAINLIVQISRMSDGTRKVTSVTEVVGMEGEVITTQELFRFEHRGVDERGRVRGIVTPTGMRPRCTERLAAAGVVFSADVFSRI